MDEEFSQLPTESSRFDGPGFFVLDEPESALSFSAQLALLSHLMAVTADGRSQVILSTHSPVLASVRACCSTSTRNETSPRWSTRPSTGDLAVRAQPPHRPRLRRPRHHAGTRGSDEDDGEPCPCPTHRGRAGRVAGHVAARVEMRPTLHTRARATLHKSASPSRRVQSSRIHAGHGSLGVDDPPRPVHARSRRLRCHLPLQQPPGAIPVLAAREQRRRARETRDLVPAPPGWRNRR